MYVYTLGISNELSSVSIESTESEKEVKKKSKYTKHNGLSATFMKCE